jgi:hypothetical protein
MLSKLSNKCFEARAFVIVRNHFCTVESQLDRDHVRTREEAERNIVEAIRRITRFIPEKLLLRAMIRRRAGEPSEPLGRH